MTTTITASPADMPPRRERKRGAVRWDTVGPFRRLTSQYLASLPHGYALTLRLPNGTNLSVEKGQHGTWTVRHHTWQGHHLTGLLGAERLPRPEAQAMRQARREGQAK